MDVVIVGCGVSGLSCGVRLQEAGYPTTIVTREVASETTSAVAAAVWHPSSSLEERAVSWATETLRVLHELARVPESGVGVTALVELFDAEAPDPWWRGVVHTFSRANEADLAAGYRDGYVAAVPLIETHVYLAYLQARFLRLRGRIRLVPEGLRSLGELRRDGRLIVNCAGVEAGDLAGDPAVHPIRGQLVRVQNPGLEHCLLDERDPAAPTYVIPRRKDCVLGGTAERGAWDPEPDPRTTRAILARCTRLEPRLQGVRIYESTVGFRSGRNGVRLEAEPLGDRCSVIHDYGHDGAGFTLSWGCADHVLALARSLAG